MHISIVEQLVLDAVDLESQRSPGNFLLVSKAWLDYLRKRLSTDPLQEYFAIREELLVRVEVEFETDNQEVTRALFKTCYDGCITKLCGFEVLIQPRTIADEDGQAYRYVYNDIYVRDVITLHNFDVFFPDLQRLMSRRSCHMSVLATVENAEAGRMVSQQCHCCWRIFEEDLWYMQAADG